MNINAGISDNDFFLQTGGPTENKLPLRSTLTRLPAGIELPE